MHQQRERVADIFSRGHGVKEEAGLARVRLLGEVKPERGIVQRQGGVFEKLALRRRGQAALGSVQVALGETGATKQRLGSVLRWRRAAMAHLTANPVTVGSACRIAPAVIVRAPMNAPAG